MNKHIRPTDGFTLIELMVTLALVGLVVIGGFRLYYFADRSFVSGTLTADIQADIQLAMQRITNELRLAHRIEFGKSVPNSGLEEDDHYLFIDEDGLVVLRTQRGDQILTPNSQQIGGYHLSFDTITDVPEAVRVELKSINEQVDYGLEADIQVLNIRLGGFQGTPPSNSIYFTKTLSVEERQEAEAIRRRCFLASLVFDDDDHNLNIFRSFRDETLKKTKLGQAIIDWYYNYSPHLAEYLADKPLFLELIRTTLKAFAVVLEWQALVSFAQVVAFVFLFRLLNRKRCNIAMQ